MQRGRRCSLHGPTSFETTARRTLPCPSARDEADGLGLTRRSATDPSLWSCLSPSGSARHHTPNLDSTLAYPSADDTATCAAPGRDGRRGKLARSALVRRSRTRRGEGGECATLDGKQARRARRDRHSRASEVDGARAARRPSDSTSGCLAQPVSAHPSFAPEHALPNPLALLPSFHPGRSRRAICVFESEVIKSRRRKATSLRTGWRRPSSSCHHQARSACSA